MLARRFVVSGLDKSPGYIAQARRRLPHTSFVVGDAASLPFADDSFDGAVMLDVLEHLTDPAAAVGELARVLRPGGVAVVSVPNRGLLASVDSLNVYTQLFGASMPLPTDDPSWPDSPVHRHFSSQELRDLLSPWFHVERVTYTGVGLAELINLALLITVRRRLNSPRLYSLLQYAYFAAYIFEDEFGIGRGSYHLMVTARRR